VRPFQIKYIVDHTELVCVCVCVCVVVLGGGILLVLTEGPETSNTA
jgi:hypothetical protein